MTERKDNKRNGISIRECVLGPGSMFLTVWVIISLFRIGDADAWSRIGRSFVILFLIWGTWCLFLDYSRKHSWDLTMRKRRHRRAMRKMAAAQQKRLAEDPGKIRFLDRKGAKSYVTTRVLMVLTWIVNICMDYNDSYTFADAWHDVIVPVWLGFTVVWIAWVVLSYPFRTSAGKIHVHID